MMLQAEVYVYEDDKMIQGFVGLSNEYMEGIFVSDEMQSCGIGKLLLEYIKNKKVRLRLNVYQKNARAISFYQREGFDIQCEGFDIQCEGFDDATGEKEYTMLWQQKQKADFGGGFYMEFNNKVVIVTGGAQGIGKTIAEELPL